MSHPAYARTGTSTSTTDDTEDGRCDCGGRLRSALDRLAEECYLCRNDIERPETSDPWRDVDE